MGRVILLGELISKVEKLINTNEDINDASRVFYDFEYLFPTEIDSWRGSYAELALNINLYDRDPRKVLSPHVFLDILKEAVGKTFVGYKGGEYKMSNRTEIHVANYSHGGNTVVTDIEERYGDIILVTRSLEE